MEQVKWNKYVSGFLLKVKCSSGPTCLVGLDKREWGPNEASDIEKCSKWVDTWMLRFTDAYACMNRLLLEDR